MNYLITGGAGFIGSNFIKYMFDTYKDNEIYCLDSLTYAANIYFIDEMKKNVHFHFVKMDICDKEKLDVLFEKYHFDYVINFAAESHVDNSIANPNIFIKTNYEGVANLLDECLKHGKIRFHQISTDEVYGDVALQSNIKCNESSLLKPSSVYSSSKAAADLLVLAYRKTYDLPVTISRCSNNYGYNQHEEKMIPNFIKKLVSNTPIGIYGDGTQRRNWIHVLDHCRAIDLIINKGRLGEIYNINGDKEIDNNKMAELICDCLKKDRNLITHISDRLGHDVRYSMDDSKIKNDLGFRLKYSFDEEIYKIIDWYKNRF